MNHFVNNMRDRRLARNLSHKKETNSVKSYSNIDEFPSSFAFLNRKLFF